MDAHQFYGGQERHNWIFYEKPATFVLISAPKAA
jgi:hypothetical protein